MRAVLFAIFILAAGFVEAQQNEIELNPVTITASFQPLPVARTGRNIASIPGAYFNKLPVHSIDELLKYLPGIEVQARGPMGSQADIIIRGGTFQQVLVILDGLRLNDPVTGHFNSYIPIAPVEIDRIEIMKGAASAIYGSEAVGGVIHIFTKTFVAKINAGKKEFSAHSLVGQFGLWAINAGGLYQKQKTSISGGLLSNNSTGQLQRGTKGYFNNNTLSLSAGHYLNEHWHLSIRTAYDKRKFAAQNFYTTFKSDTAREEVETYWKTLNLAYEKAANKFTIEAGYKKVTDEYAFNNTGVPNKNISSLVQLASRFEHLFSPNTGFVTGIQLQNKQIWSNDRGDHQLKQFAGFIILNQAIGKHWFVMPAIRTDYTENSGTEFVPQLTISYNRENIQLRGSAGKTTRQADFTERYNNYNKALVSSGSIGNPALDAERSFSYEVGIDLFIKKQVKLSAGFFRRAQKKLIDWTPTAYSQMPRKDNLVPTGKYALASNIASVTTAGFETDLQYQRSLSRDRQIFATAGMVWLNSQGSDSVKSFYIISHAKFLANFNMGYSNKWFGFCMNGIYKSRIAQTAASINATLSGSYFILNTRAELFMLKQKAAVFIEASNLFDRQYSDLLGSSMPGRWLMGGVKLNFRQR